MSTVYVLVCMGSCGVVFHNLRDVYSSKTKLYFSVGSLETFSGSFTGIGEIGACWNPGLIGRLTFPYKVIARELQCCQRMKKEARPSISCMFLG